MRGGSTGQRDGVSDGGRAAENEGLEEETVERETKRQREGCQVDTSGRDRVKR